MLVLVSKKVKQIPVALVPVNWYSSVVVVGGGCSSMLGMQLVRFAWRHSLFSLRLLRQIEKGKRHGVVDIAHSVIACKRNGRRIDVDADDLIYHMKVKTETVYSIKSTFQRILLNQRVLTPIDDFRAINSTFQFLVLDQWYFQRLVLSQRVLTLMTSTR